MLGLRASSFSARSRALSAYIFLPVRSSRLLSPMSSLMIASATQLWPITASQSRPRLP
jgi:hypothetical protein